MRLDHLLSRENLENPNLTFEKGNQRHRYLPRRPQHPASRAPSDMTALSPGEPPGAHLDSCIATERKRDSSECEVLRDSRIDAILRDQPIVQGLNLLSSACLLGVFRSEDVKGARRMPWHRKPMKGAASCDKPRGGANGLRSGDARMGEPARGHARAPPPESNRAEGGNRGN